MLALFNGKVCEDTQIGKSMENSENVFFVALEFEQKIA